MTRVVLPFRGHEPLAFRLALRLGAEIAPAVDESIDRSSLRSMVSNRFAIVVRALRPPDTEVVPLLVLARQARRLGAEQVVLVAPRLSLRDAQGEARRKALGRRFEGVIAVTGDGDPESTGSWTRVAAGPLLTAAIAERAPGSLVLATADLRPWMEETAATLDAPLLGAPRVAASGACGGDGALRDRTPVILADSVGDGCALAGLARELGRRGAEAPLLAVVHADFAPGAEETLAIAGVRNILSTNTLLHSSNRVDVSGAVADALAGSWPRGVGSSDRDAGLSVI